jgi:type IV pilus assembly protein PilW
MRLPVAKRGSKRVSGVTLIELLVAMAIGLVMLAAISLLFINSNRVQVDIDRRNRLIDNGRYALELLGDAVRQAGYFGEFDRSSIAAPPALPDPCLATEGIADLAELRRGVGLPLQAYDAPLTAAAAVPESCGIGRQLKAGSDVLVLRRVQTTSTEHASIVASSPTVYVQGSQCDTDAPTYRVDSDPTNLDRLTGQCSASSLKAPANRLMQEIYFIATDHEPGDGIPTLKKIELQADGRFSAPIALVEGIEFLQASFGIDDPQVDGVPDLYADCAASSCNGLWDKVVSVRLYLVARDAESTSGYSDGRSYDLGLAGTFKPGTAALPFRRQLYVTTVPLPNVAQRREKP